MRPLGRKDQPHCHLAIPMAEAVYIEKVEPPGFIRMDTWSAAACAFTPPAWAGAGGLYSTGAARKDCFRARHGEAPLPRPSPPAASAQGTGEKCARRLSGRRRGNNLGARCLGASSVQSARCDLSQRGLSGTIGQVNAQTMPRIVEALKDRRACLHAVGLSRSHRRVGA